jgi:YidC/Oxa1 family membrane protein insertase
MFDDNQGMHPEDKKNLIIFILIGFLVYFVYDHYFIQPKLEALKAAQIEKENNLANEQFSIDDGLINEVEVTREEAIGSGGSRYKLDNGTIFGSILLKGGRIDDISLKNYFQELEKENNVVLFSPNGTAHARYAEFGWVSSDSNVKLPNSKTLWRIKSSNKNKVINSENRLVLEWNNGSGLVFEREITIDKNYLIKVKQRVFNKSNKKIQLSPYSLISQHGIPKDFEGKFVVHEGPIAYVGDELTEISYKKMAEKKSETLQSFNGWIGFSEKYWFSSLIPEQGDLTKYRFVYTSPRTEQGKERYQVDVLGAVRDISAGDFTEVSTNLFIGAKEMKVLEEYEKNKGFHHFDLAVDFGLYYFLTKPLLFFLSFLAEKIGSFGIAILCLTVLVRLAVFPLAQKSFKSFAKLREIAPEMKELRDKYGDDKTKLQEKLVKLYEKEKVNPMAGCLPILIQIPIFFALFKVLSVSIEMRHAPFYGWIKDMSVADPTSFLNLFGLLPYEAPGFLTIGAWPCIMLVFLLIQKSLNPPAQDKTQAFIMNTMPFFITLILANFAAGMVIYWTFSNALSILQQYILMRSMGQEIHLFKRSKEDKEMEELVKEGPSVHPELGVIEDEVEEALGGKKPSVERSKPITSPKPKKKRKKK